LEGIFHVPGCAGRSAYNPALVRLDDVGALRWC